MYIFHQSYAEEAISLLRSDEEAVADLFAVLKKLMEKEILTRRLSKNG